MRSDMSKVLVERERIGVKGAALRRRRNRRVAKRDLENAPTKVSMGRHRQYGWDAKQLNENLSPLKRFIEANLGRPWDKVYSEIRAHVRFENTVQQHIMQHLWQYVERNAVLNEAGVPCYPQQSSWSWHGGGLRVIGFESFFIHPTTGILSRGSKKETQRRKEVRVRDYEARSTNQSGFEQVGLIRGDVYVKDGGIWYAADMRSIPEGFSWGVGVSRTRQERRYDPIKGVTVVEVPFVDEGPKDVLLGRRVGTRPASWFSFGDRTRFAVSEAQRYYGRLDCYCAGKGHQLDTKALRRLGLQNGDH